MSQEKTWVVTISTNMKILKISTYTQLLLVSQLRRLVTSLAPRVTVVRGMLAVLLTRPRTTCSQPEASVAATLTNHSSPGPTSPPRPRPRPPPPPSRSGRSCSAMLDYNDGITAPTHLNIGRPRFSTQPCSLCSMWIW